MNIRNNSTEKNDKPIPTIEACGCLELGFKFYGPFDSAFEALEFGENHAPHSQEWTQYFLSDPKELTEKGEKNANANSNTSSS